MMRPPRILQFGTSRFLQAHVDLFVHQARAAGGEVGPIAVVQTSRSAERVHRLTAFNSKKGFPVVLRGLWNGERINEQITVRSVVEGLAVPTDWERIADLFVKEIEFVISNTSDHGYDIAPPDREATLGRNQSPPHSFPAILLALLWRRWDANRRPLTILPCELVSGNGQVLHGIVSRLAAAVGAPVEFLDWIASEVMWVDTLVDRIVSEPIEPAGAVAEPYALWAIADRPDLRLPCVHPDILVTSDLATEERLKLHILNLGHTALVHWWLLEGSPSSATVRGLLDRRRISDLLLAVWNEEVLPVFDRSGAGGRAHRYADITLERFRNPFLDHRLSDIAVGHRSKLDKRIAAFIRWGESLGYSKFPHLRAINASESSANHLR